MGGWVPGWVGVCVRGEGLRECMAWFGGLSVCSLVSKRYIHEFFPMHFSLGLFFKGFNPWAFLHGFLGWPKDW